MKKYIFIKDYGTPGMLGGLNFAKGDIVEGKPAPMGNTSGISINYFNSSTGGVSSITISESYLKEYSGEKKAGSNDSGTYIPDKKEFPKLLKWLAIVATLILAYSFFKGK